MGSVNKQVSLHGRKAFISDEDKLAGRGGLVAGGGDDKPAFIFPGPDTFAEYDDFTGFLLDTGVGASGWQITRGTDTGADAGAQIAQGFTGGVLRLTAANNFASPLDVVAVHKGRNFKANQGQVRFLARVKLPAITNISAFAGFTDDTGTIEAPIYEDTGAGVAASDATDAVGFLFDTANGHTAVQCVGVQNGADRTPVDLTAPTANVWETWEILLDTGGDASFFRNGVAAGYIADAVTPTVPLTPTFSVFPHTTGVGTSLFDVDYANLSARRDTGT